MNRHIIDFHSHILPEMDDGSTSVEESLEMIRCSAEQGVRTIVLTPHFYATSDHPEHFLHKRRRSLSLLREELARQMPNAPRLIAGAEVRYFEGITEMEDLPKMRIEGTDCLLLEMPFARWNDRMLRDVTDLAACGEYTVILAHVERYAEGRNPRILDRLISEGVLMQSNGEAFLGGFRSRRFMKFLWEERIHLLGSDSHNTTDRVPNLGDAYDAIAKKYGEGFMERLYRRETQLIGDVGRAETFSRGKDGGAE